MWKNRLKLYTSPESDIIPNNDNVNIDYSRTIYYTLHVFNVLSTFKHYFNQNMMFSSVNTYNFHSNVKEIKKISVNLQVERVIINTTKEYNEAQRTIRFF